MKTLLVFPPTADPAHPPLGICSLAAFLRDKGEEVSLLDLNIRSYNELLTAPVLTRNADRLLKKRHWIEAQDRLPREQLEAYRNVAENLLSADFLTERIDEARAQLRDPATYTSRTTYGETVSLLRRAMEFISAAYFPTRWCPGAYSMRYSATRSEDVLAAVGDREENLFLEFLERYLSDIRAWRPQIVGISLNYYCQMIPALTLASLVKEQLPESFLLMGGGLICFFDGHWEALAPFRNLVDGWIPFEGERPLYQLIECLNRDGDLSTVEGLLRFVGETPSYLPPSPPPTIAELPPPSFTGLDLDEYLSPEPILPVLASRGCYWGRCAFCSHDRLYRGHLRSRTASGMLEMTDALSRQYGAKSFYLVDEAIPPKLALEFANAVIGRGLSWRWFGEVRFEDHFSHSRLATMYQGGCRMLMFGLESGVERILELMEKGIRRQEVAQILHSCCEIGIRTFVMFFVGFPTETRAEADATIEFVDGLRDKITHVSFTQFILERYSPVFRLPGRYGVFDISSFPDDDLKTWCQYCVEEGLTSDEARDFTKQIRRHAGIQSISDLYLLSRSHLIFLPHRDPAEQVPETPAADLARAGTVVPMRRAGLVPARLAFNLEQIAEQLDQQDSVSGPLQRCPTNYVFCPDKDTLVEVGADGIDLLKACSGRFTLGEILETVGQRNQSTTLEFLNALSTRQLITWERRP